MPGHTWAGAQPEVAATAAGAPGPHDGGRGAPRAQIERDEQLNTFQAYRNRFRSPYEQSFSTDPLYYSLDVGPMHIIMLNAVRPARPARACGWARGRGDGSRRVTHAHSKTRPRG